MKTYKLYDLKDLAKFRNICSYDFADKFKELFDIEREGQSINTEQKLTDYLKLKSTSGNISDNSMLNDLKNDIHKQIKNKAESIARLDAEIKELAAVKEKILKTHTIDEAFEIIAKH